MKLLRRLLSFIICVSCIGAFFSCAFAETDDIREAFYQYCESELGLTRDNLTPNQYVQNEDGSWDFSLYVKDADPGTNGLVIGSLDSDGKLIEIKGPAPVKSVAMWLNRQIRKCMFDYRELYLLKQQWEPKLDSIPEKDMETLNAAQSFNPILDFLKLNIVLPDEKCIPYEEARQKTVEIIESMNGWKPEMTDHVDVMVELLYIPDGMDHPVWQFIYSMASSVFTQKTTLLGKEYTDEVADRYDRMADEEDAIFGQNLPCMISIRIDAHTGEQVGETYIETPPISGIGFTGIVLWK